MSDFVAVGYQVKLQNITETDPLFGCSYFGQTVGTTTAEKISQQRWRQEINQAARQRKQVGFIAVLKKYGPGAFTWNVVETKTGSRDDVQKHIDTWERTIIASNGGVMRSMTERLHQTLNIMPGGKNHSGDWWSAIETVCLLKWTLFQQYMIDYVQENGNAAVPTSHIASDGYPLGARVHQVRSMNSMLVNRPDEAERRQWLDSIGWSWKCDESIHFERISAKLSIAVSNPEIHAKRNATKEATFAARRVEKRNAISCSVQKAAFDIKCRRLDIKKKQLSEVKSGIRKSTSKNEQLTSLLSARRDPEKEKERVISRRATTLQKRALKRAALTSEAKRRDFDQRCAANDRYHERERAKKLGSNA